MYATDPQFPPINSNKGLEMWEMGVAFGLLMGMGIMAWVFECHVCGKIVRFA